MNNPPHAGIDFWPKEDLRNDQTLLVKQMDRSNVE
jgi:hypothetical protein